MKQLHQAIREWMVDNPQAQTVWLNPELWFDRGVSTDEHANSSLLLGVFTRPTNLVTERLPITATTDEIVQCLHNLLLQAEMNDNALLCSTTNPEDE